MRIIEGYITDPRDLTVMLTEVRAMYDEFLRQSGSDKFKAASLDRTLTGCLNEVRRGGLEGGCVANKHCCC